MAFALSIVKLAEAMEKPGCMICRMEHEAAVHVLTSILWESTTDFQHRKMLDDAYGFCPPHLRMFVAIELSKSGPVLGTHLIYESILKNLSADLKNITQTEKVNRRLRTWLAKLGIHLKYPEIQNILQPCEPCPACKTMKLSGENTISTLCEVITNQDEKLITAYEKSDGMCFRHLRIGITKFMTEFPSATEYLIQDTQKRLSENRQNMQEFIRKHNWAYRDEGLTEEERLGWVHAMTFFSGYADTKFTHHIDEF